MVSEDPPSALLTKAQRRYLRGEAELSPGEERAIRARIRQRVRHAILDFPILLRHMERRDIEKAFEEPEDVILLPIGSSIPDALGFFYLAEIDLETAPLAPYEGWSFERTAVAGISRALNRLGVEYKSVTVDIEIERGEDLDELAKRDLADLSMDTLRQMHFAGVISEEEYAEEVIERRNRREEE